jgi:adsorption protein B
MAVTEALLSALQFVALEAAFFSAAGFAVLGLADLAVDAIWLVMTVGRLGWTRAERHSASLDAVPLPEAPGLIAIFVPAWDEAAVIRHMLRNSLEVFRHENYRLYVGCYPNDAATIRQVGSVADARIRLVVNARPGPTTKADCLNNIWKAMLDDEKAGIMYQTHQGDYGRHRVRCTYRRLKDNGVCTVTSKRTAPIVKQWGKMARTSA